jgi:uncharacterized protein YneF (UPF0154 family)
MEHQVVIDWLITVSLVLGIVNSYYIAKYLIKTRFPKIARKPEKEADKPKNIED